MHRNRICISNTGPNAFFECIKNIKALFSLLDSPWRCWRAPASWRTVCWTGRRSWRLPERRNTNGTEICRSSSSWNTDRHTHDDPCLVFMSWTEDLRVFVFSDVLVIDEHFSRILGEGSEIGALDEVIHAGQLMDKHTQTHSWTCSHSSEWFSCTSQLIIISVSITE